MINPNENGLEGLFTMESEKTGIVEEPPFRMLVLGDWSGDAEKKPLLSRTPKVIDRDNFDAVMAGFGAKLDLDLNGESLPLTFSSMDDLHPDAIFQRLAVFSKMRELRRRLKDESTFASAAREVREKFGIAAEPQAVTEAAPEAAGETQPSEGLLDAILSHPSGGAAVKPGVSSDLGRLIGELVRPHLVSVDEDEQSQMLGAVDNATGELMRRILHDRRFREFEAAWRGLHLLVHRAETSNDLKIYILDVTKAELEADLKNAAALTDSLLYRHLVRDAVETPGADPWAVALGNFAFEGNVEDVATLIRVGRIAAAANAPFIAHIRPDVLGLHSLSDFTGSAEIKPSADSTAVRLWEALRDQPESVYLGMAMPRFLARLPYGKDTDPAETIAFEEVSDTPAHDDYVWANPCFVAGLLLAESFSESGWKMGHALKQDIEGLPVHIYKEGTETVFKPCAEVLLSQSASERMMEHGIMPLVSYKNSDKVKLARFQSIADTALKGLWN